MRSCVDGMAPDGLMAPMPLDTAIRTQWLAAGGMEQDVLSPTETGVPQGGGASPVFMNRTRNGVAQHITGAFPRSQGRQRPQVHVLRCADEVLITGTTPAFLQQAVSPLVEPLRAERGLELSRDKTRSTPIEDGCDGLGTHVRKSNRQVRCTASQKHVQALRAKVRHLGQRHRHATAGPLSLPLHPIRRGWAQSPQQSASKRTCAQVDQQIFTLLWQWARRRHLKQSRWWLTDKDFRSENGNNWGCCGHVVQAKGPWPDVRWLRATSVPMRRHTTIQGEANPYDPQWEPACEARWGRRMARNLRGRRQVLRLGKAQAGRCALCHQRLTELTGWHSHHSVWRAHGGSERTEHRVLLHPGCHAQVHSQG